jgi:predicted 3-demethylubiquinone-9 3-methyltransferase (glyoxalase superfamily)
MSQYGEKLADGGDKKALHCGRLKDKQWISWQIVRTVLPEMISDCDEADNPERGAVCADLLLHCVCRE